MYEFPEVPKGGLKAHHVVAIYKKHGEDITLEQAEKILEFTQRLANIAVDQLLREEQEKEKAGQ